MWRTRSLSYTIWLWQIASASYMSSQYTQALTNGVKLPRRSCMFHGMIHILSLEEGLVSGNRPNNCKSRSRRGYRGYTSRVPAILRLTSYQTINLFNGMPLSTRLSLVVSFLVLFLLRPIFFALETTNQYVRAFSAPKSLPKSPAIFRVHEAMPSRRRSSQSGGVWQYSGRH